MPPKYRSLLRQNLNATLASSGDINQKQAADLQNAGDDDELGFETVIEASPSQPRLDVSRDGATKIVNTHDSVNDFLHSIYVRMGNGEYFVENAYVDATHLFALVSPGDHLLNVRMRVYADGSRTRLLYEDNSQYTSALCREIVRMDTPLQVHRLRPIDQLPRDFLEAKQPPEQQEKQDAILNFELHNTSSSNSSSSSSKKTPQVSGVLTSMLNNSEVKHLGDMGGASIDGQKGRPQLTAEQEDQLQEELKSLGLGIQSHIKFKDVESSRSISFAKKQQQEQIVRQSDATSLVDTGSALKEGQQNKSLGTMRMMTMPSVKKDEKSNVSLKKESTSRIKLTSNDSTVSGNSSSSSSGSNGSTILPKSQFKHKMQALKYDLEEDSFEEQDCYHPYNSSTAITAASTAAVPQTLALPAPTSWNILLGRLRDHVNHFVTVYNLISYKWLRKQQTEFMETPVTVDLSLLELYHMHHQGTTTVSVPYRYMRPQYSFPQPKPKQLQITHWLRRIK